MKIYRNSYRNTHSEHTGYEYFSSQVDAKKANKGNGNKIDNEIYEMEIDISKKGILDFLNTYCSYPDNG